MGVWRNIRKISVEDGELLEGEYGGSRIVCGKSVHTGWRIVDGKTVKAVR